MLGTLYASIPKEFKAKYRMCDVAGVRPSVYNADLSYSGSSTADPTSQLYLHLWCRGNTGIAVVPFAIELEYDVEWFDPVALAQS